MSKKNIEKNKGQNINNEEVIKISFSLEKLFMPLSIILAAVIISVSLSLSLYLGLKQLSGTARSDSVENSDGSNDNAPVAANPQDTNNQEAKVTIDDDPILGDKNKAKVAIVEFSDYECPFCKRHHQETFDQIVEEYVNTGKAIMVYRDFPLSFHDPLATTEALAAECVQDIAGDSKYFEYSKLIFENTSSNGNGLKVDDLYTIADQISVDSDELKKCVDEERFLEEIQNDIKDGTLAGITGTPGFVIGVLDEDGNVDGVNVSGAQPYTVFKQAIEQQLDRAN
jgi:protein-disulfide isomerase